MDPACQLAQFLERFGELPAELGDDRHGSVRVGADLRLDEPEAERHRDEPLLGTIVEVPLEAPPLGVPRLDDTGTRFAQVVEMRAELGVEALVLEREAGRGRHGPQELRRVAERRIVHDRRDATAVALDPRRHLVASLPRQLERPPSQIDEAAGLGDPVRETQRRIAESVAKSVAERSRRPRRLELAQELGDARPRQPAPDDAGEDGEGDGAERDEGHPADRATARSGGAVDDSRRRRGGRGSRPR